MSFWIFWDCEGQDRGPNAKALIWVLVDDLLVGDLSGDRLEDMPWHAMTCHDMPWHAMTCLHPVSGVSDAYLPSTSVYRFEHFDYMNHTLLEAFQGHDSVIQGCFLVTMICWVEILMWRALRTCLDWNWLPRAVLDQSAIRFYNSEQVLCWLHWMLQCILGDALDKSLQIWLEVQYVGMANQLCSATLRETWTSRLPR